MNRDLEALRQTLRAANCATGLNTIDPRATREAAAAFAAKYEAVGGVSEYDPPTHSVYRVRGSMGQVYIGVGIADDFGDKLRGTGTQVHAHLAAAANRRISNGDYPVRILAATAAPCYVYGFEMTLGEIVGIEFIDRETKSGIDPEPYSSEPEDSADAIAAARMAYDELHRAMASVEMTALTRRALERAALALEDLLPC